MTEEKKEEIKVPVVPAVEAQQVQNEAPAAEPKAETPKESAAAPKAAEAKKEEPKIEKPANCSACKKSIKNKRWYYRNSNYFCSKRCWQTAAKKDKTPAAEEAPKQ